MGRPRKNKIDSNNDSISKPKMSLAEKQEIALKRQHEREKLKITKEDPNKFYCTNKTLMAELIKWRDSAPDPKDRTMSEDLGRMILQISTKLTNHSNFRNYSNDLKQEMVSYACYKIIQGLNRGNFNFNFNNPFAYMTQAAWNACISVCAKHYKQINLKRDLIKQKLSQIETTEGMNTTKIINNFIRSFLGDEVELNDD